MMNTLSRTLFGLVLLGFIGVQGCSHTPQTSTTVESPAAATKDIPSGTEMKIWTSDDLEQASPERLAEWIETQQAPLMLVDYWATWCAPCVEKFPKLVELSEKYSDGRLSVLAISCNEVHDREEVLEFLNRTKPRFAQWIVPDGVYQANVAFDLDSVPTYRLFNRRGELLKEFSGGAFEFEDIERQIELELSKGH
jgi:thiol-disulfide isomerase/thioredoxin